MDLSAYGEVVSTDGSRVTLLVQHQLECASVIVAPHETGN